jgi:hypothetical protein
MLLLMAALLPLFGALCIGLSVDSFRTQAGFQDIMWGVGAAVGAPILLWLGVRSALGGIRADSRGVQIRNVWTKHDIPWDEVKDIIIHQESDEGVGAYKLRFLLAEGDVTSTYPETWGSDKPLERARLALLRLRDDALEGHSR